MKIKPAKPGSVTVELDKKDADLLAESTKAIGETLPIKTILAPIDFSEYSYKSLDYASAFAKLSGAEVVLLNVVPLNYVDTEMIAFDYTQIAKESANSAQAKLELLREDKVPKELSARIIVRIGRPVEEIITAAKQTNADLIIMSTHGYTGLKHAFLGSTTENVVRYAPCPVLTLRQHEHDFITPSKET